nr:reverse transcriptase domain-containing protein [Tanacetum cinerariifolium]
MATEGNDDPPVLDLQTMEELCQPSLNGQGRPMASTAIQATNFELKNDMIQQVQNSCQFHGLSGDDANKHLDKFLHVTQSIKVNGVTVDALRMYLFPHSLTHHATAWLTLRHHDTINAAAGSTFMERRPKECYDLIKNMTAHHNDWDTSAQQSESSSSITSSFDQEIIALKDEMAKINKNLMKVLQINQQVKEVTPSCETCGCPHSYNDCPATVGQTQNVYAAGTYQGGFNQNQKRNNQNQNFQNQNKNHRIPQGNNPGRNQFFQGASHGQNPPPAYQAPAYKAPGYQALVHQPPIPQPQVVTTVEFTNYMKANDDTVPLTNNGNTKDVQPLIVQIETPVPNSEPVVAPVVKPVAAPCMSTRSSGRNLVPPLEDLERTIRRRNRSDPVLLFNFEEINMANNIKTIMSDLLLRELRNEITNFRQRPDESLFKAWERYKLSIDHFSNHNMLPVTQIDTFYNWLTLRHRDTINVAAGGTFMKRRPEECYDLIENMTAHHNDWDTSIQRSESSSSITSSSDLEIVALKAEMAKINKNLMKVLQINQQVKVVAHNCETCGGPHSYNDCPATVGQTQNVYAARAYNQGGFNQNQNRSNQNQNYQNQNRNQGNNHGIPQGNNQGRNQFFQGASHGQNPPPAYQELAYQAPGYQAPVHPALIPQPQSVTTTEFTNYMKSNDAILKNMQTNMTSLTNSNLKLKNMFGYFMKMNTALPSGSETLPSNTVTNPKEDLKGFTTRSGNSYQGPTIPTTSSPSKVVECETEKTKDTPVVAPIVEPVEAPVSALKPNPKPSIPYPSILHDQKLRDKTNDQKEKIFQIFQDLDFNISFADALILIPKFGPTIKSLLTNKEKLFELARTPLNEHCSAVLLKKLPKKLGDPGKFLIPCDFSRIDECLALANLSASINLIPLSVWNKLSLLELPPTCMTLELVDRSISRLVGVAEDVFVKTGRALIDVYERELTHRVGKEAVTFNLDKNSRYSTDYNAMSVNRIDLIDVACEEYSQEVLVFSVSGNPTPSTEPIFCNSSPTLTPFGDSDFFLEETDAFLAIDDEPISP